MKQTHIEQKTKLITIQTIKQNNNTNIYYVIEVIYISSGITRPATMIFGSRMTSRAAGTLRSFLIGWRSTVPFSPKPRRKLKFS